MGLDGLPATPSAAVAVVDLAVVDGLIDVEFAVADLDVVTAIGVGADPCLVMDWGALAAEIAERDQVAVTALAALR